MSGWNRKLESASTKPITYLESASLKLNKTLLSCKNNQAFS